jgi:hypothetical protein
MSTRTKDLKTAYKVVTSKTSQINLGGQVPTGMKRWVTFLSIDSIMNSRMSTFGVHFASVGVSNPTIASIVATGNKKLVVTAEGTQASRTDKLRPVMHPPEGPNPDAPLFSIASGKWIGVMASLTTVGVFMQYYDE